MALVANDKLDQKEVAAASVAAKNAGFPVDTAATVSVIGSVLKMSTQAASVAPDIATMVTDFNALITKLKAAGLMA